MKTRNSTIVSGILLTLILIISFLPACAEQTIPPSPSSASKSQYSATSKIFNWRYNSNNLAGTPTFWPEMEFAASIRTASSGRLNLDLQPNGALVGVSETFSAVAKGDIETGAIPDHIAAVHDPMFNLTGVIPASFTWEQAVSYYYYDQQVGRQDTDKLFEKFGVKRFVKSIAEPNVAVMSREKKITETQDFKGIRFRGSASIVSILQEPEFGVTGSTMAAADVYTSLQNKVFDAVTVSNAFSNWGSGYHEVTKYWSFPGMQRSQVTSFLINLQKWNELPPDIQEVIKMACSHTLLRSWAFTHVESAKIIPVLQQKHGIEIVRLSPECQQTWKSVSWRLAGNIARENPDFKKMWESQKEFINLLQPYEELQRVTYTAK